MSSANLRVRLVWQTRMFNKYVFLFVSVLLPSMALATYSVRSWSESRKTSVTIGSVQSTTQVQGSLPQCTITVFSVSGGLTTIYADSSSSPLRNPFKSQSDGTWYFYVASGHYSIIATFSQPGTPPVTYLDVL